MDNHGLPEINTTNPEEEKHNYKGLKIYAGIGFAAAAATSATGMLIAAKPEEMLMDVKSTLAMPNSHP